MNIKQKIEELNTALFPESCFYERALSWQLQTALFCIFTLIFSLIGLLLPADGFIGFDWVHFFSKDSLPPFYPPWTILFTRLLNWPFLIGITMSAYTLAVIRRAKQPASAVSALLCLPLFWSLFLGQLEGFVLTGLICLPWLAPLALIKPQVAMFAFTARKQYLLALAVVMLLSIVIWGPWFLDVLNANAFHAEGRFENNIALGLWGLPLALAALWFSRGDMDMLMLAGSFITPYLLPYNLLPLCPAIARLKPWQAGMAALLSWTPLLANWLGPWGWWLGWSFVVWLWSSLALERYGVKQAAFVWKLRFSENFEQ